MTRKAIREGNEVFNSYFNTENVDYYAEDTRLIHNIAKAIHYGEIPRSHSIFESDKDSFFIMAMDLVKETIKEEGLKDDIPEECLPILNKHGLVFVKKEKVGHRLANRVLRELREIGYTFEYNSLGRISMIRKI